jgi:TonB family protein
MDRLGKKCFIASCGMHVVLVLVVLFGAAFFTPDKKPAPVDNLTMIPSRLIDDALSGGGGNPKIAPSDAKIKGDTLDPVPPQPVKPQPEPPKPKVIEKPQPKPEEPTPPKIETPKPTVKTSVPKDPPKTTTKPKEAPLELTPVNKSKTDREKARKEAEAKAQASEKAAQDRLAKAIGNVRKNMTQGFTSGTAVDVHGPGGEAYASYRSFVFAAYDNAWLVKPDIANDESVVIAQVVIHRTGKIVSARIVDRSGNVAIDKSVQSALDRVDHLPPFPPSATDQERTFTIEFSLKAKRLVG